MKSRMDVPQVLALARQAGDAIMAIYRRGFEVDIKADNSPMTEADLAAHRILSDGLSGLAPGLPVLSEESAGAVPTARQRSWQRYWLVDPLDGTREFIRRNDEFTVNIALVEDGRAVFGVIHAPALGETGWGQLGDGAGAWWQNDDQQPQAIRTRPAPAVPTIAISRSHASPATVAVLEALGEHETLRAGSALKFLRLAQGEADLYPRLGPTSEWDTAAGQCLLEAAGGELLAPDGRPFRYNQRDTLLNGSFLAVADPQAGWQERLAPAFLAAAGDPS